MPVLEFDPVGTLLVFGALLSVRLLTEAICRYHQATPEFVRSLRRTATRCHEAGKASWAQGRLQLENGANEPQRYAMFALGGFLATVGLVATLINFPILAQVLSLWLPGDGIGSAPPFDEISRLSAAMAILVLLGEVAAGIKLGIMIRTGERLFWLRTFLVLLIGLETLGAMVRAHYASPDTTTNWSDPGSYGVVVAALLGFVPPVTTVLAAEYGWTLFGEPACASFYHRIQSAIAQTAAALLRLAFGSEDSRYLTDPVATGRAESQALRTSVEAAVKLTVAAQTTANTVAETAKHLRTLRSGQTRAQTAASLLERAGELDQKAQEFQAFANEVLQRSARWDGGAVQHFLQIGKSARVSISVEAVTAPDSVLRTRTAQALSTLDTWIDQVHTSLSEIARQARDLKSAGSKTTAAQLAACERKLAQCRRDCAERGFEEQHALLQERAAHLLESLAGQKQKAHLSQALSTSDLTPGELDRNEQEVKALITFLGGELAAALRRAAEARDAAVAAIAAAEAALAAAQQASEDDPLAGEGQYRELIATLQATRLRIRLGRESLVKALRLRSRRDARWHIPAPLSPSLLRDLTRDTSDRPAPADGTENGRIRPVQRRPSLDTAPHNSGSRPHHLEVR